MNLLIQLFTVFTFITTATASGQGMSGNLAPQLEFTGETRTEIWEQLGMDIDGEAAGDDFGEAVSLSADGETAAITARDNAGNRDFLGHTRIFRYDARTRRWAQLGSDIDGEVSNDRSGNSVALSKNGETVIIGASNNDGNGENSGHARVFHFDAEISRWIQLGMDIDGVAANDLSGWSVSLSADGETAIIGAPANDTNGENSGHARAFRFDTETGGWVRLGTDITGQAADDRFGSSVSLSADGETAIIGAPFHDQNGDNSGHAIIFRFDAGSSQWVQLGMDIAGEAADDRFGTAVSLSADGETAIIGAPSNDANGGNSGHARVFRLDAQTGGWIQLGSDIAGEAAGDRSGSSVSLSADGETAIIGGPETDQNGFSSGHARIFRYDTESQQWIQLGNDIDGENEGDQSGTSVSLSADGETTLIGARGNNGNGFRSGHARIYRFDATQINYSIPENTLLVTDADTTDDRDLEGSGLTYSLSGMDGSLFSVNRSTGVLAFAIAPDFENPTDEGGDNVYNLRLVVTDSQGLSNIRSLEITVTDTLDLISSDPLVGSVGLSDDQNITLVFDRPLTAGLGNIILRSSGDNSVLQTIPIGAATLEGTTLSFSLDKSAMPGTRFYIEIPAGVLLHPTLGQVSITDPHLITFAITPNSAPKLAFTGGALTELWEQLGLDIDGEAADDVSGASVSMSTDGNTIIIGAPRNDGNGIDSGHARIFRYHTETGQWTQLGQDIDGEAQSDASGTSVSLSADGETAIIGAALNDGSSNLSGHARIFQFNSETSEWQQLGSDIDGERNADNSGTSVALDGNGLTAIIGAPSHDGDFTLSNGFLTDSGHARIFRYNTVSKEWFQLGSDINGDAALDAFGTSVSLSADGKIAVIGATNNDGNATNSGHVKIFHYDAEADNWVQLGGDIGGEANGDFSGGSVALSADGQTVIIGAQLNDGRSFLTGHARVFRRDTNTDQWLQLGTDIDGEAAFDFSGGSVALSADGETASIGATGNDGSAEDSGHTRIYRYNAESEQWLQVGNDIDGEAAFDESGVSVALSSDGETVIIGAQGNDTNGTDAGHAKAFRLSTIHRFSVIESSLPIANANATDDRNSEGAGLIYSLSGVDSSLFTVDRNSGQLSFTTAPDFDNPRDNGSDNIYNLQFTVTDSGGLSDTHDVEISVTERVGLTLELIPLRSAIVAGGDPVDTFRVTVTNNGLSNISDLMIASSSVFPPGVSISSADPSAGVFSSDVWTLDLPEGKAETLTVFLQAQDDVPSEPDSVTYEVEIRNSDHPDSTNGKQEASASISVANAEDTAIQITMPPEVSLQSGLFITKVTVTNNTRSTIPAQRLFVFGLPADATVHNATGTDSFRILPAGTPYLLSNLDLVAGASVEFTVEILRESLDPDFSPQYTVELLADDEAIADPAAEGVAVDRIVRLANGDLLIEFASQIGDQYAVEYSCCMVDWIRVTPTITAVANRTQWIDNGPPKTESHPSAETQRFYRFVPLTPAN